ncbi:hypothetical protein WJU23_01250 [Prosthecobacter sp. SYSU 5D2]|uniref:hypothetical protein n=1 Tax=Prosthecobacter sp. SYSU 5D2 TaxID=3134134 RepID=UPI0031FF426B
MKFSLASLVLVSLAFVSVSCSTEEKDGRQYYAGGSLPVQGRMGVQHKRLRTGNEIPGRSDDGSLFGRSNNPDSPGLLDRNRTPDEPGAIYWMDAEQSANPVQGRMGVQVKRRKKEPVVAE